LVEVSELVSPLSVNISPPVTELVVRSEGIQ
jgi:hypothetical protein